MLKRLSTAEIGEIYNKYMTVDFPADELKPLASILRMVEDGLCTGYADFLDGIMQCYVFLCEYEGFVLVDYLAVNPDIRGKGIGSRLLAELKRMLAGRVILIECENIDKSASPEEAEIRRRRIAFYETSGFKFSGVKTLLFGVDFVILTYPECDYTATAEGLGSVYRQILREELYKKHFSIC